MNTAQNSIKQQLSINWSILKIDTHTHTLKFSLNAYFKSIYCKLKLFLCCFLFVCHKCMMHETTEHCEKTKQWKIWSKFVQLNHRLKLMPNWKLDSPFVGVWAWKFGRKNKVFIVILKIHISITVNGNLAKTFECCNFWLFGGLLWCLVFLCCMCTWYVSFEIPLNWINIALFLVL